MLGTINGYAELGLCYVRDRTSRCSTVTTQKYQSAPPVQSKMRRFGNQSARPKGRAVGPGECKSTGELLPAGIASCDEGTASLQKRLQRRSKSKDMTSYSCLPF